MKQKVIGLSRRYARALRKHLKQGPRASLQPALRLGRQAVALGLETLEVARIHEQAVVTLELSKSKNGLINRAEIFFTEAINPIVQTHRAARQSRTDLNRLSETLSRRTLELAAANRQLQRGILRRKSVEAALKKSGDRYTRLLKESLHLQNGLRRVTYQALEAQEGQRKKISHDLQDEIAQTLVGVNVRLLSVQKEARGNTKDFQNELTGTQQLVVKSINSLQRAARELTHA